MGNTEQVKAKNESNKSQPPNRNTKEDILKHSVKLQNARSGKNDSEKKAAKEQQRNSQEENDTRGNRVSSQNDNDLRDKKSDSKVKH